MSIESKIETKVITPEEAKELLVPIPRQVEPPYHEGYIKVRQSYIVYVRCTCRWEKYVGYMPTLDTVFNFYNEHLEEVKEVKESK